MATTHYFRDELDLLKTTLAKHKSLRITGAISMVTLLAISSFSFFFKPEGVALTASTILWVGAALTTFYVTFRLGSFASNYIVVEENVNGK